MAENNIPNVSQMGTDSKEDFLNSFDEVPLSEETPAGSPQSKPQSNIEEDYYNDAEIDDAHKSLPKHVAAYRTLKSKYDSLFSLNEKNAKDVVANSQFSEFFNQLNVDPELQDAFINELKPGLLKKDDFESFVNKTLKDEFPEFIDSKPTEAEARSNPGGRAWLYYKKLDRLYEEYEKGGTKAQNVKELLERRKVAKEQQEVLATKEVEEIKVKLKFDDETLKNFQEWKNKAKLIDVARLFKIGLLTQRVPNLAQMNGKTGQPATDRQAWLNSL